MNGINDFAKRENSPTDRRGAESPIGGGTLKVTKLYAYKDAMLIGPAHRQVLHDKRDDFQKILLERKIEMELELLGTGSPNDQKDRTLSEEGTGFEGNDSEYNKKHDEFQSSITQMQNNFQNQLDHINTCFQREWLKDPRCKGRSHNS